MLVECSINEILFLEEYRRKKAAEGERKNTSKEDARKERRREVAMYMTKFMGVKLLDYIQL